LAAAQAQAANELANIIEPTGVVFPLGQAQELWEGCLEGMRLDLSGASQTIMAQLSKLKESIIADVMRAVTGDQEGHPPQLQPRHQPRLPPQPHLRPHWSPQ
jgi:hypothetical protein